MTLMAKKRPRRIQRKLAKRHKEDQATHSKPSAQNQIIGVPSHAPSAISVATVTKPVARLSRAGASDAERRGADLVRFLRIHARKPYGKRGEEAIYRLATEVAHLGNLEIALQRSSGDDDATT